jgi:hypothetical protein
MVILGSHFSDGFIALLMGEGLLNQKISINSLFIICCVSCIKVIILLEFLVYILHVCSNVSSECIDV